MGLGLTRVRPAAADCLRLVAQAARMLENAFRASVVNVMLAPDQPFSHGNFAPGAEAIG
jgi:hypothetical protein